MEPNIYSELETTETEWKRQLKKVTKLEKELEVAKAEFSKVSRKREELKKAQFEYENKLKIKTLNENIDHEWINREFGWSEALQTLLKSTFGFDRFRPKQLAAINATMTKKDVLLVMPTGGGKSLTYQLPALYETGFTLVVSPLLSLIEDQLFGLKKVNVNAAAFHGGTSKDDNNQIYVQMLNKESDLKLVYVTPEWLAKSKRCMSYLKKAYEANRITRVAIDEVHCCSTWGHDFRPDYGFLGILRETLDKVPFLGLTATATMNVLVDVQTMLSLKDCLIITAPFNRPNLFYKVLPKPSSKQTTLDYLVKLLSRDYKNETGIIYTTTINESINLASDLKQKGLKVAPYHAQLEPGKKKEIHQKWIEKKLQAVIATMAFGMGIDKPDVRFVIHHTLPKSMESLYQESGRAGRDGKQGDCIVLFSLNDYFKIMSMVSSLVDEKKALSILEYCLDQKSCRRSLIAKHFEEVWDRSHCNKMCDHCKTEKTEFVFYDFSKACTEVHLLIDQALVNDEKLTLTKLLDGWFHTGLKKLRVANMKVPSITRQQAEVIVSFLLLKKYLAIDKGYSMYSTICYLIKGRRPEGEKIEMFTSDKYLGFPKRYPVKEEQKDVDLEPGEPLQKKIKLEPQD